MNLLILVLFFIGIIVFLLGYFNSNQTCPKPKTVYKYIDRTLAEAQMGPDKQDVYDKFKPMFTQPPIIV